jgi:hypothetical protein
MAAQHTLVEHDVNVQPSLVDCAVRGSRAWGTIIYEPDFLGGKRQQNGAGLARNSSTHCSRSMSGVRSLLMPLVSPVTIH